MEKEEDEEDDGDGQVDRRRRKRKKKWRNIGGKGGRCRGGECGAVKKWREVKD